MIEGFDENTPIGGSGVSPKIEEMVEELILEIEEDGTILQNGATALYFHICSVIAEHIKA